MMRVDLNVPYDEKDRARRLGARWDSARRTWYVENKENLEPFLRWMPSHLRKVLHIKPAAAKPVVAESAPLKLKDVPEGWTPPWWCA